MSDFSLTGRWRLLVGVMRDRDVRRLLLIVGSRAATDVALFLATSVVAYDLGGPAAVGLVGAVRVFPSMLTASGAALVTDRVHRPHVIAGVNAVFVLVALALAAGVAFGAHLTFLVRGPGDRGPGLRPEQARHAGAVAPAGEGARSTAAGHRQPGV